MNVMASPRPIMKSFTLADLTATSEKRKFLVDPLLLSVAKYRTKHFYDLDHPNVEITNDDISLTAAIRAHYRKKYFWKSLHEGNVSEFAINCSRLLDIAANWELDDNEVGLFIKLPFFYAEDMVYKRLKEQYKTSKSDIVLGPKVVTLTFIESTYRWQKHKKTCYWFTDDRNLLYAYNTLADTPFLDLFEEKLTGPITIERLCGPSKIEEMHYHNLTKIKFVKE